VDHLPWYKRPSAIWLFPIYGLAAVSAGMLISTVGQFRAALLCREYQLRHAPSDSTNLSIDIASFIFQAAATASNSATLYGGGGGGGGMGYGGSDSLYAFGGIVRPGPECQTPEIQAYTAKIMALIDVLGNIAGKKKKLNREKKMRGRTHTASLFFGHWNDKLTLSPPPVDRRL